MTSSTNGHETSWQDSRPAHMQYGWERPACLLACLFLLPAEMLISALSPQFRLGICCCLLEAALQKKSLFMKDSNKWVGCVFTKMPRWLLDTNHELTLKKQQTSFTLLGIHGSYEFLLPFYVHQPVGPFSSDCWQGMSWKHITHRTAHWISFFLFSITILFHQWK